LGGCEDISDQSDERPLHQNPGHGLEPIVHSAQFERQDKLTGRSLKRPALSWAETTVAYFSVPLLL
jgi:hypothetical protein